MKVSQNCLDLIKKWEGYEPEAYIDPVGIPTIGYGTTRYPNGKKVRLGDKISEAEGEAFLLFEVNEVAANLDGVLKEIKVNQNQYDALVSLCYNIGVGGFSGSTILKKLKAGDLGGASEAFALWNKGTVNGVKTVLPGLVNRRKQERELFDKPGKGGTPIDVSESPQDFVTLLEGYRDGGNNVIVAWAGEKVVEILSFASFIKDDLIATLRHYKNAGDFQFAPSGKPIPAGERIEIGNKGRDIPKVESPPKLERKLLMLGVQDDDEGVEGSDVKELQMRLKDLGYYSREIDGIFGKATDEAARAFQKEYFGIAEADGKVGPITWAKLWGGSNGSQPKPEGKFEKGKTYLLLTKTPSKDTSGCFKLKLEYIKDGQSKESILVNSGQPRRQFFRKGKDSISGSMEPLPEGRWLMSNIQWAGGKDNYSSKTIWQPGIGPAKIFLDYVPVNGTRRQNIEIHLDWNKETLPGTAGCIGVYTISDFKILVTWLRDTDPRDLYVDWGLGSVKIP